MFSRTITSLAVTCHRRSTARDSGEQKRRADISKVAEERRMGRKPTGPVWFTGLMVADVPRRGTSDFNYPIKPYSFQKGRVVTDDEERAVESPQCFLEKLDGFDIKVVGRLVENDQPWRR